MAKKITLLALLFALVAPSYAEPEYPVRIMSGFLTGNSFINLSFVGKRGYVMGFFDGIFVSPMFNAPKSELKWIEECAAEMTNDQIVAILEKYLRENPKFWHNQMNILVWSAMKDACGKA